MSARRFFIAETSILDEVALEWIISTYLVELLLPRFPQGVMEVKGRFIMEGLKSDVTRIEY